MWSVDCNIRTRLLSNHPMVFFSSKDEKRGENQWTLPEQRNFLWFSFHQMPPHYNYAEVGISSSLHWLWESEMLLLLGSMLPNTGNTAENYVNIKSHQVLQVIGSRCQLQNMLLGITYPKYKLVADGRPYSNFFFLRRFQRSPLPLSPRTKYSYASGRQTH